MRAFWSRRGLLTAVLSPLIAGAEKGKNYPADGRRYLDPVTEFEVLRLTDPSYTSVLPFSYERAIARKGSFLIYGSDRGGTMQLWRLEARNAEARQLSDNDGLDPATATLTADDRYVYYCDASSIHRLNISNLRDREIYKVEENYQRGEGFSTSEDGLYGVLPERRNGKTRLRLIDMAKGSATTIMEFDGAAAHPQVRPKRAAVLYTRDGNSLWLTDFSGAQHYRLQLAPGGVGAASWSPDGRTVIYISIDEQGRRTLREFASDAHQDRLIAPTTQFVGFGRNPDSSVFVGVSGSKASPYVLLLIRTVKRELTLCEHRASDPLMVRPTFSPTSQRIYFQSDRDGKPAIYSMVVDRLVEKTET